MSFLDGFLNKRPEDKKENPPENKQEPEIEAKNEGPPLSKQEKRIIHDLAADKIREIYDPEIPVNIFELGLIYDIDVDDYGRIMVSMTLTSPHCPVAETMPGEVEMRVSEVPGAGKVQVALVWEPPWDMSMMSEAARLEMGFM